MFKNVPKFGADHGGSDGGGASEPSAPEHVRQVASRLSWLLSALEGNGAASAEEQVAALIDEARSATREADSAARLSAAVQQCTEFVDQPSQEGLAALASSFSQCEGLALDTQQGTQVLDVVASILASEELARDEALGAAETLFGVDVPADICSQDCNADAFRVGIAAAKAAAKALANSDASIPQQRKFMAKFDECVSAFAQPEDSDEEEQISPGALTVRKAENLMPWWSGLQEEVTEMKEQIKLAAQEKIGALAAELQGTLRAVREAMQRDGTGKGWKEFLPESHSWQDVVNAMELTFWVPLRSGPEAKSISRISRLEDMYAAAQKHWTLLESTAQEMGVAVPEDTQAEYAETQKKALVANVEEFFVRVLEEGGNRAGTKVMKRQAYIVQQELFDYEAEILPLIKTCVQKAISGDD